MHAAALLFASVPTCVMLCTPPPPPGYSNEHDQTWYKLNQMEVPWQEAVNQCREDGATLAVYKTLAAFNAVQMFKSKLLKLYDISNISFHYLNVCNK